MAMDIAFARNGRSNADNVVFGSYPVYSRSTAWGFNPPKIPAHMLVYMHGTDDRKQKVWKKAGISNIAQMYSDIFFTGTLRRSEARRSQDFLVYSNEFLFEMKNDAFKTKENPEGLAPWAIPGLKYAHNAFKQISDPRNPDEYTLRKCTLKEDTWSYIDANSGEHVIIGGQTEMNALNKDLSSSIIRTLYIILSCVYPGTLLSFP